jgi:hypothetical protein
MATRLTTSARTPVRIAHHGTGGNHCVRAGLSIRVFFLWRVASTHLRLQEHMRTAPLQRLVMQHWLVHMIMQHVPSTAKTVKALEMYSFPFDHSWQVQVRPC